MALLPPLPEPAKEIPHERHLRDRAVFLGEFARNDPNQRARESKDRQKKTFEHCLDQAEHDPEEVNPKSTDTQPAEDQSEENDRDVERTFKLGGEIEARRHSGGWRGPNLTLGMGLMPDLYRPPSAPIAQTDHSGAQKKASQSDMHGDPASAPVDPAILSQLREAGLTSPVSGFHDSRLREEHALLNILDGWKEETIPGGRNYHWQACGPRFQRVRLTGSEGLIESSNGIMRQVIEKAQGQYNSTLTPEAEGPGFSPPSE